MSTPLVSVVISTRDRPTRLPRALRSALEQTLQPHEVIVVDDGELGGGVLDDPRVRVVRSDRKPVNRASAARNQGVASAQCELIAFLDDDDAWHPDKLARQLAVLGPADATFCGYELVDDDGEVLGRHEPVTSNLHDELLLRPLIHTSGLLVRRGALLRAGGFDEDLDRTEDWLLALRLAEQGQVVVQPEVLVSRTPSTLGAAHHLHAVVQLYEREIEPRLSPRNRAGVAAYHRLNQGVLLAQMGRRREAVSLLWRSSARWQVLRLLTGERAWAQLRRLVRGGARA